MNSKVSTTVMPFVVTIVALVIFVFSMYYALGAAKPASPNNLLEDVMSSTAMLQTLADQITVEYDVDIAMKEEKGTDFSYLYDTETGQLKTEVANYLLQLKRDDQTIDAETLHSLIKTKNLKTKAELEAERKAEEKAQTDKEAALVPQGGLDEIIQTPSNNTSNTNTNYDEVTLDALLAELQG